ncbi:MULTISPECIES: universal stress protein [Hyphomicrobium]|jgi:nucleotide-binding universal stress UspA family protein|uniref:universal stress protein n=1 Tax=Hyphomicrobium TaxID=81 RepID=UPI00035E0B8E|nr:MULTISPECIES: universal stress protein [Hyphomicrobium]WBT39146.1 universal stress protein [Hyphomicrobium sp. DMF-1]HML43950.1 universal stress protein [Hyphomicrobium zavarzinii]
MTKILCAVDDTEHSKPAIDLAAKLALALKGDLTVATVNQLIGGYGRGGAATLFWTENELQNVLQKAAAEAKSAGIANVKAVSIESRDLALAITDYAREGNFDHIVVGTGGKSAVSRMMLGSVSRDVVHLAHCPVTVAR